MEENKSTKNEIKRTGSLAYVSRTIKGLLKYKHPPAVRIGELLDTANSYFETQKEFLAWVEAEIERTSGIVYRYIMLYKIFWDNPELHNQNANRLHRIRLIKRLAIDGNVSARVGWAKILLASNGSALSENLLSKILHEHIPEDNKEGDQPAQTVEPGFKVSIEVTMTI